MVRKTLSQEVQNGNKNKTKKPTHSRFQKYTDFSSVQVSAEDSLEP